MTPFVSRMIRASMLDVHVYEEVEADKSALGPAMAVVALSSLAGGVVLFEALGVEGMVIGTTGALIGWFIWAFMTYFIGTKLLPEPQTHADLGQLLRTIGFSSAPGLIRVLGFIPGLADPVHLIAGIWMLVAMVIAVRQALDYHSTLRAVGVCVIGWVVQVLVVGSVLLMFGGPPGP
ncbi:MAG: YIP1 family protein [Nitrospirota bacterium]|nr:MAG: YIP1 family protein [Nitrospirota bacterium]